MLIRLCGGVLVGGVDAAITCVHGTVARCHFEWLKNMKNHNISTLVAIKRVFNVSGK